MPGDVSVALRVRASKGGDCPSKFRTYVNSRWSGGKPGAGLQKNKNEKGVEEVPIYKVRKGCF